MFREGNVLTAEQTMSAEGEAPFHFDVRDFARTAAGSHRGEIDLASFDEHPLDASTLRTLSYLRELERSTMTYLRNVLVTPTHKDAKVTAFLTTWAYEKYWIADAFDVIVRAHGIDPESIQTLSRMRAFALDVAERATPIVESFRANAIGPDIVGVHLASVTIDEWMTESAYRRLAGLAPHPVLSPLLETVLTVKKRHLYFVEHEARARLDDSKRARSLARRRLARTAWPIGAASIGHEETAAFYAVIVDDAFTQQVDARVDSLPGQSGLGLVRRARAKAARAGTSSRSLGRWLGRTASTIRHGVNG
jgi:hypothetical protein